MFGLRGARAAMLIVVVFVTGCAGRTVIDGAPLAAGGASAPNIDGAASDWQGRLQHVESAGISVAATRDADYVYLVLATNDRGLQGAILHRGLTVWLDGAGGSERRLGLRYPTGLADAWGEPVRWPGRGKAGGDGEATTRPGSGAPDDEVARRERIAAEIAALPAEFLLFRGDEDSGRLVGLDERAAPGLALALGMEGSRLVYELRFPLRSTPGAMLPALGLSGGTLGVGLQLTEPAGDRPRRGGGPGGAMGGMGDAPGDFSPPERTGPPPDSHERYRGDLPKLDTWLEVKLDG
ncbi:MAG: hypothetical protein R3C71_11730 [Candidatus Krumholzibacteriia bacterium]|nr:hypothetical protein [Candidatus Latescibacterota bacterium]